MLHVAYNGVLIPLRVAFPLYAAGARLRGAGASEMRQRLGYIEPASGPSPLWIQAASLGEVRVAAVLIESLARALPARPILLTTTTRTGQALAKRSLGSLARVAFFPLDFRSGVRRFLDASGPSALVLVETEIWPNLLVETRRRRIPVLIVNGRLSDRAFARYRRASSLFGLSLGAVQLACVQTETDAERFHELGLPTERLRVTGNIKFAAPAAERDDALLSSLGLSPEDEVWVAGSTAEGEEEAVLSAFLALPPPDPAQGRRRVLVVAPRRPERFEEVARLLAGSGRRWSRRSAPAGDRPELVLLDSLGELPSLYAAASVAFVGGSLVPLGGQSPIEPASRGVAPVFGPHIDNFRDVAARLLEAGGAFQVDDASALARLFARLEREPSLRRTAGEQARSVVAENARSIDETLREIVPRLSPLRGAEG